MDRCAFRARFRGRDAVHTCDRSTYVRPACSIAVLVLGFSVARFAAAEPLPPFIELLHQAESSAPRLIEAAANVQAAQGLARQDAAFPNPQIGVLSENLGGPGLYKGFAGAQTTVSLNEVVEIGGKRGSRIAAGLADLEAARVAYIQIKADFAHDLAIAYATAEAAQVRAELLAEEVARAGDDLRVARSLVDAGRESDLRSIQAQAAVTSARADLEAAHANVAETLARLSSLVGSAQSYDATGSSILILATTLQSSPAEPPSTTPAVLVAEAEREAAARRVDVERKRAISDLNISLGSRRLAIENVDVLIAGVSVALPIFDRNRGAIAARRAELAAAEARLTAARLEAEANWRAALAQARAADNRLKASADTEIAAREAYRLARIGYDAGRTPLIELLVTRRGLIDAQMHGLDARLARIQAEATLARLAGRVPFGE